MEKFKLVSEYLPTKSQKNAINQVLRSIENEKQSVLQGLTGTGKTFMAANVITKLQKNTLVLVSNKTLAGQLHSELKKFFPNNRVEYFVSYFDYYQPEAYIPTSNTYIDKTSKQNAELERLRMSTFSSLLSDKEAVIVVASVASIFGAYNPNDFKQMSWRIYVNEKIKRKEFMTRLVQIGYTRTNVNLNSGQFRLKGDVFDIMLPYSNEYSFRVDLYNDKVQSITKIDVLDQSSKEKLIVFNITPGSSYVFAESSLKLSVDKIKKELHERLAYYDKHNKLLEKQRLSERVNADIESLSEFGICSGIENYSQHLELREDHETPYTLLDYFGKDWLIIVDESHISLPQVSGMFNGDQSRKKTLVKYGFRLPSALNNRPLNFEEFNNKLVNALYLSATPSEYETNKVGINNVVEQIYRPTGLLEPKVIINTKENQLSKINAILNRTIKSKGKCIVLTLTIRMAEEVSDYLINLGYKAQFIHNELKTLERLVVLNKLRKGKIDIVVGINLLREGLDLPEVSTIIILDADTEGFLRNKTSLIQMFGRAARNVDGTVYLFADKETRSIKEAVRLTNQRRSLQIEYNKKNKIIPKTIEKPIFTIPGEEELESEVFLSKHKKMSASQRKRIVKETYQEMLHAAKNLEFEKASRLRDVLVELDAKVLKLT